MEFLDAINVQQQRYADVGNKLASSNFEHVQGELESFKANLEEFAQKHKTDINRNPEFRRQFQKMCTRIGVDPLRSNKGFWADVLGSVNTNNSHSSDCMHL